MADNNGQVKTKLTALYDELFSHEGYGHIEVDIKILRRGQKEVIIRCGKEYRFVVDFPANSEKPKETDRAEVSAVTEG